LRTAVLDLGTNTFHLLIIDFDNDGQWSELHRERQFVFLGENGLDIIPNNILLRAEKVLSNFRTTIKTYNPDLIKVVATEGVRRATNSEQFIPQWQFILASSIDIISGLQEARFVGHGILSASSPHLEDGWGIDIGGGSIELIFFKKGKIINCHSLPIGLSVLYDEFHSLDKMPREHFEKMKRFLRENLVSPFQTILNELQRPNLYGAAGTFEIMPFLGSWKETKCLLIDTSQLPGMIDEVLNKDEEERSMLSWLPSTRSKYIIESLAIIDTMCSSSIFDKMLYSPFALKEGIALSLESSK